MKFTPKDKTFVGLVHLAFWLIYLTMLAIVFKSKVGTYLEAFSAATFSMISHATLVYIHLFFLLPFFYDRKAYGQYVFWLLVTLVGLAFFRVGIIWPMAKYVFPWLETFMDPSYSVAVIFNGIFVLLIAIPLRLVRNTLKKEELEIALKNQQLEAELKFLRTQVNPHFLFNSWNNIYSLAFTQSTKTPDMILRLSDMMSYMLYDCKSEKVNLSKEIDYLQNYIALQQLKKDGEYQIEFEVIGIKDGIMISPMLFIPFFENAFKHGNLEDVQNGWLKSEIKIEANHKIYFHISNSFNPLYRSPLKGGVGLENVKERLELLYPNKHHLNIRKNESFYEVDLNFQAS